MGLERYVKDDEGFRKYVELLESTPTKKRQTFIDAAKRENPEFVETAQKYILTFERISNLPELELTEVLGSKELKPEVIAIAINSVEDDGLKEKLIKHIPREVAPKIALAMKDKPRPDPYEVGGARLQVIKAARELEKNGKLDSVQIPRFGNGYFTKRR